MFDDLTPEWEGEPEECPLGRPTTDDAVIQPSFEAYEPVTPETGYHLAHVLNDALLFDPAFLDHLATL